MKKYERWTAVSFKGKKDATALITLIRFKEEDAYIVYSPQLEVSGYGKTEKEAEESFSVSLKMFLDYTTKKKTLHDELISLGWKLKKGTARYPQKVNAPNWRDLLKNNAHLESILSTQNISTSHQKIAVPV